MSKLYTACLAAVLSLGLTACGDSEDGYGSIAYSPSTYRAAIVTGGITQSAANDAARDKCDANDCSVILQFEECGAISGGRDATGAAIVGVGRGGSEYAAQTAANDDCTAKGGLSCDVSIGLPAQCN